MNSAYAYSPPSDGPTGRVPSAWGIAPGKLPPTAFQHPSRPGLPNRVLRHSRVSRFHKIFLDQSRRLLDRRLAIAITPAHVIYKTKVLRHVPFRAQPPAEPMRNG